MREFKIGDRITLELKASNNGCEGCIFNDYNLEGCYKVCGAWDGWGDEGSDAIFVEAEETHPTTIDWEQRRYEIAKDLYCRNIARSADEVVKYANELINKLMLN